jgi:hypothetical protein
VNVRTKACDLTVVIVTQARSNFEAETSIADAATFNRALAVPLASN